MIPQDVRPGQQNERVGDQPPVIEVSGAFRDAEAAHAVAEALNRWFRWIIEGTAKPVPPLFEPLGADTHDYAWELDEDVDWTLGPHARVAGSEVRISIQTHDTHLRLAGLLKGLGARTVNIVRDNGAVD